MGLGLFVVLGSAAIFLWLTLSAASEIITNWLLWKRNEEVAAEQFVPEVSQPEVSQPEVSQPEVSNPELPKCYYTDASGQIRACSDGSALWGSIYAAYDTYGPDYYKYLGSGVVDTTVSGSRLVYTPPDASTGGTIKIVGGTSIGNSQFTTF